LSWRLSGHHAGDDGFGLIELVVAISLLAIMSLAFMGGMMSTLKAYTVSRGQTVAEQVATDQMESIRRLGYDQVGLVGGNPPGTIPNSAQTKAVDGYSYTVVVDVEFVDDPVPTAAVTQADYKRVTVTVTQVGNSKPDATMQTLVATPSAASSNNALLDVSVIDADNTPLVGASVSLTGGPSANRTDLTSAQGEIVFPALAPNPTSGSTAYYNLAATLSGYMTSPDDISPKSTVHWNLAAAQSQNTTIHMYKPVSVVVNLKNSNGTPFTTVPMTVTLHSARGDDTFSVPVAANGTITLTQAYGEYLMPLSSYTVSANGSSVSGSTTTFYVTPSVSGPVPPTSTYPTTLQSTFNLTVSSYTSAPVTINLRQVQSGATGLGTCSYSSTLTRNSALNVNITGGPQSVSVATQTVGGVVQVLLPTGATPYTVTVPTQGSYSGSGTIVVNGASTCNLKVG
jgi:prepilin-type N-terminal cleavage/methylation domain-containing protein